MVQRQQMQIVISKHGKRTIAQRLHKAQGLQGLIAAIDQVAAKPQGINGGIEINLFEESAELGVTALDITYRVYGHGRDRLMQHSRGREHEFIYFRIEMRAVVGLHLITAFHRAYRGFEHRARGINELFSGF